MKNIAIAIMVIFLGGLFGCATTHQPDLTGKWINPEKRWGLEFRDGQVFEWERGKIRNEGTFTLSELGNALSLVVTEGGKERAAFRIEMHTQDRLLLRMGEEQVELKKQSTDPTKPSTATE